MTAMPTLTPWTAHDMNVFAGRNCIAICDTDNAPVSTMQANAALIVRAVNAHDALVAALECVNSLYGAGFADDVKATVRAALAAAQAEVKP